jgi:hypothetical protein
MRKINPAFDALWPPQSGGQPEKPRPGFIDAIRERRKRQKAANAEYCTKHYIEVATMGNRPDRLVWRGGRHRTPGNACDGPKHQRAGSWGGIYGRDWGQPK